MHRGDELPLLSLDTPMSEALLVITHKGFGVAAVVDDAGALVGIITDGDLRRNMVGLLDRVAGEVMTRHPLTIRAGALASEALGLMNARAVTTLFVVADAAPAGVPAPPAGILHVHDCLRAGIT
jgi:arabinose-5-phosphate isomerase